MTTSQAQFLAPILSGEPIPKETLVYFRTRLRLRLQEFVLREFTRKQARAREAGGQFTRADLARRIHRRPELVTRWLGGTCNLTADTVSDLLLGMAAEPDFAAAYLADVMVERPATKTTPRADVIPITSHPKRQNQATRQPGLTTVPLPEPQSTRSQPHGIVVPLFSPRRDAA
jgi:hypothetical protein